MMIVRRFRLFLTACAIIREMTPPRPSPRTPQTALPSIAEIDEALSTQNILRNGILYARALCLMDDGPTLRHQEKGFRLFMKLVSQLHPQDEEAVKEIAYEICEREDLAHQRGEPSLWIELDSLLMKVGWLDASMR